MPRLLYNADRLVMGFVGDRLGFAAGQNFGPASSIGIEDRHGDLIAGAVYHNLDPRYDVIEMSVAASTPRWLTPRIVRALLAYPFEELGVRKILTTIDSRNERSVRLTTGLGFAIEAKLPDHCAPGGDLLITALWRHDWEKRYGEGLQRTETA